jgi:hypothetical protein
MAITTYAELKTAVENWLDRTDLTSRVPEWIAMAEDRIGLDPRIRIRAMETTGDLTIDSQTEALPTGFVQSRRIYIDGNNKEHALEYMTPTNFWDSHGSGETGRPLFYTVEGDNYVFGPSPDSTYTGKQLYYKKFDAFSTGTDTNWLLTNARGLYLYGALIEAAIYIEDDAALAKWAALYDSTADSVLAADRKDRYPAGPLVARSGIMAI